MNEELLLDTLDAIPSKTYKVQNGRIAGFVDELEAMRQSIEKVLSTERFFYNIYSDNYGIELNNLIGQSYELAAAEIERLIQETLSVDERIIEVKDFEFKKMGSNESLVAFNVFTLFGKLGFVKEVFHD